MPSFVDDIILAVLAGTPSYLTALAAYPDSEAGLALDTMIRLSRVSTALR